MRSKVLAIYLYSFLLLISCAFKILISKLTEKRCLGRSRHRWNDNVRMDFKEINVNMRSCIDYAQGRDYWKVLVNMALNHGAR
jgi:hypothetical protein